MWHDYRFLQEEKTKGIVLQARQYAAVPVLKAFLLQTVSPRERTGGREKRSYGGAVNGQACNTSFILTQGHEHSIINFHYGLGQVETVGDTGVNS